MLNEYNLKLVSRLLDATYWPMITKKNVIYKKVDIS